MIVNIPPSAATSSSTATTTSSSSSSSSSSCSSSPLAATGRDDGLKMRCVSSEIKSRILQIVFVLFTPDILVDGLEVDEHFVTRKATLNPLSVRRRLQIGILLQQLRQLGIFFSSSSSSSSSSFPRSLCAHLG